MSILDPTYDPRLIDYVRGKDSRTCSVFNFYSLYAYGIPLNNLFPMPEVVRLLVETMDGDESSRDFDIAYANQLLMNPQSFIDLMNVLGNLEKSDEVFILSNYTHPNMTGIVDSLIKFIQERYSLYPLIINTIEDIDEYQFCDFHSKEGYMRLISDLDRFKRMYFSRDQIDQDVL